MFIRFVKYVKLLCVDQNSFVELNENKIVIEKRDI